MMVSKITEVTIFESPDGGRTVYARQPGDKSRSLHYQDPKLQQELENWKEKENGQKYLNLVTATQHLKTYVIKLKCYTN